MDSQEQVLIDSLYRRSEPSTYTRSEGGGIAWEHSRNQLKFSNNSHREVLEHHPDSLGNKDWERHLRDPPNSDRGEYHNDPPADLNQHPFTYLEPSPAPPSCPHFCTPPTKQVIQPREAQDSNRYRNPSMMTPPSSPNVANNFNAYLIAHHVTLTLSRWCHCLWILLIAAPALSVTPPTSLITATD